MTDHGWKLVGWFAVMAITFVIADGLVHFLNWVLYERHKDE